MRKLVGADFFILMVKTLKGINLITDTPLKRPIALAIGLPDVGGRVWFLFCVPNHRDFTESELQRIPYSFHTSYLIKA